MASLVDSWWSNASSKLFISLMSLPFFLPMRAPNTELGLPSWASVLHTPSQNTDKCENFCIYLDQCSEMFLMTSGWRDTDTVAATQLSATTFSEVSSL